MRISDWSSDVCSSDLPFAAPPCERWGRAASCDGREAMLCLCASRLATYASFHCIFAKMGRPEMNQAGDVAADLRTLLAIAREGSLAGAARRLRVNHSTVFRRLGAIEARLGARLFERQNGSHVTKNGRPHVRLQSLMRLTFAS